MSVLAVGEAELASGGESLGRRVLPEGKGHEREQSNEVWREATVLVFGALRDAPRKVLMQMLRPSQSCLLHLSQEAEQSVDKRRKHANHEQKKQKKNWHRIQVSARLKNRDEAQEELAGFLMSTLHTVGHDKQRSVHSLGLEIARLDLF